MSQVPKHRTVSPSNLDDQVELPNLSTDRRLTTLLSPKLVPLNESASPSQNPQRRFSLPLVTTPHTSDTTSELSSPPPILTPFSIRLRQSQLRIPADMNNFELEINPILELKSPTKIKIKGCPTGAKNKKSTRADAGLSKISTWRDLSSFEYKARIRDNFTGRTKRAAAKLGVSNTRTGQGQPSRARKRNASGGKIRGRRARAGRVVGRERGNRARTHEDREMEDEEMESEDENNEHQRIKNRGRFTRNTIRPVRAKMTAENSDGESTEGGNIHKDN